MHIAERFTEGQATIVTHKNMTDHRKRSIAAHSKERLTPPFLLRPKPQILAQTINLSMAIEHHGTEQPPFSSLSAGHLSAPL
jgi:hypothetical protein